MTRRLPARSELRCHISDSLMKALHERCQRTGESLSHVVQASLAAELGVEHHTLFQVSTSTALVQGVYQGCVKLSEILQHGDFGLGTFDSLDGEGILFEGQAWHARGDGTMTRARSDETAPFWVVTRFEPEHQARLAVVDGWEDLCGQLDHLRTNQNLFVAFNISGTFERLDYRVACRAEAGEDLVTATAHQAEFSVEQCEGNLVGFWTPSYAKAFNVPGYHLHFLSADRQFGGHLLGFKARDLEVQWMQDSQVRIALPETQAFLQADLSQDPSQALAKAEQAGQK